MARGRCEPVPKPASDSGFIFDPKAYAVRFVERNVALSAVDDSYAISLAIMDLDSKRQVVSNPAVSFGYRLELANSKKLGAKCQGSNLSPDDAADCRITPDEEFVALLNPFGTLYADERPFVAVRLVEQAFDRLTPGTYQTTLRALFSNGTSDSITLTLTKTTLSGTYTGRLSVYVLDETQYLGNSNLSLELEVATDEPAITWNRLLARENLRQDIHYTTEGYEIRGFLSGNDSPIFNHPAARDRRANRIAVRGLYSPALGRMRLIGVIEIAAAHCVADEGECTSEPVQSAWERLQVPNVFGRRIRRALEFMGPYDATLRKFHGMYRETITGLAPFTITLDGGFQLGQVSADEESIALAGKLLPDGSTDVVFSPEAVADDLDREIEEQCQGIVDQSKFEGRETFLTYLEGLRCSAATGCSSPTEPILSDLVNFGSSVRSLLSNLTGSDTALSIYDYLREKNVFCDDGSASDPQLCVPEKSLRCGLALYRKAIANGWVSLADVGGRNHRLFCDEMALTEDPDCVRPGAEAPALVTLQEHNRFYRQLAEIQKFTAGAGLSDALYVLFRAHEDPLVRARALAVKDAKLHAAWEHYEALRREIFSPASTAVLFSWPMSQFLGRGADWLTQMHGVLRDRRDLLESIIDLKRRVYAATSEEDFVFAHQLFQEEYLMQVFLIWLQREWQGEAFQYEGNGPEMLARADMILARVNETRNPLGFHADRVFFENDNLQLANWEKYKSILGELGGQGLLAQSQNAILEAVGDLRASLKSSSDLESSIHAANLQFQQTIDSICGPPLAVGSNACETRDGGGGSEMDYVCEDDACSEVMEVFDGAVDKVGDVACRADRSVYTIEVDGGERPCVRGQMGVLLQEKVQLELQRKQIARKLGVLLRQVDAQARYIQETQRSHTELVEYLEKHSEKMRLLEAGMREAEFACDLASTSAGAVDCMTLVFFGGGGTDCIGKAIATALQLSALSVRHTVDTVLQDQRAKVAAFKEIRLQKDSNDATLRQQRLMLENLQAEVENLVSEYEMVTQQLFNLMMRLDDTHFLAKEAVEHLKVQLRDITESLLGGEPGNVLRRNAKAQEAEQKFSKALQVAYKMTMAFSHRYNLRDEVEALSAKVFRLMTPEDIARYIEELEAYERSYCAVSGIDCDAQHNIAYFRFSMREELFPTLTDIVDAKSGRVYSKGEQFHNLLTSSMYRGKRKLGSKLVEQIEVPFAIWLNDRRGQSGVVKPYMLSPLECNHTIAGEGQGTFAVNIVGTRLSRNVQYELWRGNTDFIRSCEAKEVVPLEGGPSRTEYPIHTFLVGYAPESSVSQQETAPSFVTHTGAELACRNMLEGNLGYVTDESCYNFFGRDRSLAAPDWKLVIPLGGSGLGNEWILGDGKSEQERPVVEDIVIYVRHRKRPIVH